MDPRPDDELSPAAEAFAEYLALREDGGAPGFEAFCAERSELAEDLRRLHARWSEFLASEPGEAAGPARSDARRAALLGTLRRDAGEAARYEDRGAVARGGMGEIRAVHDRTLRRTLAMKVLLDGRGSEGSRGVARFLDEARISAQLDHPGIVPVHELGLDASGRVYYTMPLIRGRHLGEVFREVRGRGGEWTRERALAVLSRVCEAVAYAHSKGVVHRDLKPANVMVGPFGETYVMDWGLAKVLDGGEPDAAGEAPALSVERVAPGPGEDDSSLLTVAGSVVGTPGYLAPEQAAGEEVDGRVDVYSIGAMLYELVTGRKPYAAESTRGTAPVLAALAAGPPTPVRELADHVPPELEAICERAMEHDRDARYPDVATLAADLRAFLEGRVVGAYESGAVAELRKWVARNRATAGAAATAVVLAVAGAAGVALSENARRAQVEQRNEELEAARAEEARQAEIARARTAEVLRLSDLGRLDELEARAADLWPLRPALAGALDAWIADAEVLAGRAEREHRPTLEELRSMALPYTDALREADLRAQPWYEARETYRSLLVDRTAELLELRVDPTATPDEIARWEDSVAFIEELLEPLEAASFERLTWDFATPEAQWEHDTLARLVDRLDDFTAEDGLSADVRARRAELARLTGATLEGPAARAAWEAAIASIADPGECPAYDGLVLEPQFGLLPIGRDPASGLWEFAHLGSGAPAARDADTGALRLSEETGVVLVLIPGGRDRFGAQRGSPDQPNHDPRLRTWEAPTYGFTLAPYFLSKYELTQAQWLRARGENPSELQPKSLVPGKDVGSDTTLLHPVETVSRPTAAETLRRLGLVLPTEARWEFAARAGTDTPWYTGGAFESLEGHANLPDRSLAASGQAPPGVPLQDWLDDGRAFHAPVGSYLPNPFGLHDVFGNVSEWCLDDYGPHSNRPRVGDGLRTVDITDEGVARGGGFLDGIDVVRASARESVRSGVINVGLGVRPARSLDPSEGGGAVGAPR